MDIQIIIRNEGINKHARQYAEEKASKLDRFFDGINRLKITLNKEETIYRIEIVADVKRGGTIVVVEQGGTPESAVDMAIDVMARQLKKYKEKLRTRRSRTTKGAENLVPPENPDDDDDWDDEGEWEEK